MSIEQIKEEISNINNNTNLTNQEKVDRIKVYQTLIESMIQESNYDENLLEFINLGKELADMSNGVYQIQESLDDNKISLKGHILDSELVQDLKNKGIDEYTLSDLKTVYLPDYEVEHNTKLYETSVAINLYEQVERLESIERKEMEIIARNLKDIVGKDLISRVNENGSIGRDGVTINQSDKSIDQLKDDYTKALKKIDELYVNEGLLDLKSKNAVVFMLNKLFDYYKNGNKKISPDMINQLENIKDTPSKKY